MRKRIALKLTLESYRTFQPCKKHVPEGEYMSQRLLMELLGVTALVLVVSGPIAHSVSSFASRFALITAFLVVLIALTLANYWAKEKTVLSMLLLASLLFLIWNSEFVMPYYIERTLNSRQYMFAKQYGEEGHLVFGEEHSYFFLSPLILHFLYNVCGISALVSIYIILVVYCIFTALIGILILKAMRLRTGPDEKNKNTTSILSPIVAFYAVSFAFSERGVKAGGLGHMPLLLMLLAMWFLFDRGFKSRRHAIIILLLVVGVTIGSTDGILLLTSFFFLLSISGRTKTAIVYSFIPLSYMLYAGYSYTILLKKYATNVWEGSWEFVGKAIAGQPWERAIPWQRTISPTREDAFVTSVAYLSLMLLFFLVAFVSTFLLVKGNRKNERDDSHMRACVWSISTCFCLMLVVATVTYIGVSIKPEVPSSDIRTIAIVFPASLLPFLFTSKRLITKITAKKVLLAFVITLIIFGSLRSIYEVYPKSTHDSVNVVEDVRLGSTAIYLAGNHINTHYRMGGIIADYDVLSRIGRYLSYSQYEERWLNVTTLTEPFHRFPESILVFNIGGIRYPSIYHSPEAYAAAYNFTMAHNRLYDNGAVLITSRG